MKKAGRRSIFGEGPAGVSPLFLGVKLYLSLEIFFTSEAEQKIFVTFSELQPTIMSYQEVLKSDGLSQRHKLEVNEFRFTNIYYSAVDSRGTRKTILNNISGKCRSGEVMAILGPSGAGKTSLLNVLTLNAYGLKAEITGSCTLNGHHLTSELFRRHFCIVPQEDNHRAFLTCRETLRFVANFYINGSDEKKDEECEKLLVKLGLDGCANTRVGNAFLQGLSGGQRKRLSVALALMKSPSVLMLDEPTSGLDAASSYHVMKYIKELAITLNIIVVATIHQPASTIYFGFQKVLLLSKGRTAFLGSPERSVSYFQQLGHDCPVNTNPAEFLLDLINSEFTSEDSVMAVLDAWTGSNGDSYLDKDSLTDTINPVLPDTSQLADLSFVQQLVYVSQRQVKIIVGDPMVYAGRAVMFLLSCTFFGIIYVYSRDRVQEQVLNRLWFQMWLVGVPSSLGVIAVYAFNEEFKALTKEVKNGMFSIWAFLLTSFSLQVPIMLLLAVFIDGIPAFVIGKFWARLLYTPD